MRKKRAAPVRAATFLAAFVVLIAAMASRASLAKEASRAPTPPGARLRLGEEAFHQGDMVKAVAFSPDGKTLISGAYDGSICVWDATSGNLIREMFGRGAVEGLACSPDGKSVFTAGDLGADGFNVWDLTTGRLQREFYGVSERTLSIAVSPDGKTVALGGGHGDVQLWDARTGEPLQSREWQARMIGAVAFSPDGTLIASSSDDGSICLWEFGRQKQPIRTKVHERDAAALAFSPDGKTLASGGGRLEMTGPRSAKSVGTLCLWDVANNKKLMDLRSGEEDRDYVTACYSPDGKLLATGCTDKTIRLWDAATGKHLRKIQGHRDDMSAYYNIAFSPDGWLLASAGNGNNVYVWQVESGNRLFPPRDGHEADVRVVAWSPDDKILAAGDFDGMARLWDPSTGAPLRTLTGREGAIYAMAFSPDGNTLALGGWRKKLLLFDVATGAKRAEFLSDDLQVTALAFSPDGKTLGVACCSREMHVTQPCSIRLVEPAAGNIVREIPAHSYRAESLVFSLDGKSLVSTCRQEQGKVKIWEVATGKQTAEFLAFLPAYNVVLDGWHLSGNVIPLWACSQRANLIASDSGRDLVLCRELWSGKEVRRFRLPGMRSGHPAFSADGRMLAVAPWAWGNPQEPSQKVIRIVAPDSGRQFHEFSLAGESGVSSLAFAGDGKTLATGMYDGTVLLWDLEHAPPSAATVAVMQPKAEEGELWIYPQVSSLATVARRDFRNDDGAIIKSMLYKLREGPDVRPYPPFAEKDLVPYMILRISYGPDGSQKSVEKFTPDMKPIGLEE